MNWTQKVQTEQYLSSFHSL